MARQASVEPDHTLRAIDRRASSPARRRLLRALLRARKREDCRDRLRANPPIAPECTSHEACSPSSPRLWNALVRSALSSRSRAGPAQDGQRSVRLGVRCSASLRPRGRFIIEQGHARPPREATLKERASVTDRERSSPVPPPRTPFDALVNAKSPRSTERGLCSGRGDRRIRPLQPPPLQPPPLRRTRSALTPPHGASPSRRTR